MKLNGLTIVGTLITAVGWLWLLFGVGISLPESSRAMFGANSVVNLQLLALAEQTCLLGYTLVIAGVISAGFQWLKTASPVTVASSPQVGMAAPRRGSNLDRIGDDFKLKDVG